MPNKNERADKHVKTLIDYKDFFETTKGKNVLYDLMKRFHYFQTSYVKEAPYETSFREGERNVLNFILYQLQQNPAKVLEEMQARLKKEMEYEYD